MPLSDSESPTARAIVTEVHWHNFDESHGGEESVLQQVQRISYIIGGENLVKGIERKEMGDLGYFSHKKIVVL